MSNVNPLLSGLRNYETPQDYKAALEQFPPAPEEIRKLEPLIRLNEQLFKIEDLFILGESQYRTAETIHRMLTGYYRSLMPWTSIHISKYYNKQLQGYTKPIGSIIQGQPGVGKSVAIHRALCQYPQVIEHHDFPHFKGKYLQVVWFSVSIRSHSRKGFVTELAQAWNGVFLRHDPETPAPIPQSEINKANTDQLFSLFLTSALVHNLGLIHIDEIQTLFSIVKGKKSANIKSVEDLSVKDDITMGKILGMFNTGIPIIISCTSDGAEGLSFRGAISQRLGLNCIQFDRFKDSKSSSYKQFLKQLMHYQYIDLPILVTDSLESQLHQLTAGIPRVMVMLFIETQKKALMMGKRSLDPTDFISVYKDFSEDMKKTIIALHNKDKRFLNTKPDYRFERL